MLRMNYELDTGLTEQLRKLLPLPEGYVFSEEDDQNSEEGLWFVLKGPGVPEDYSLFCSKYQVFEQYALRLFYVLSTGAGIEAFLALNDAPIRWEGKEGFALDVFPHHTFLWKEASVAMALYEAWCSEGYALHQDICHLGRILKKDPTVALRIHGDRIATPLHDFPLRRGKWDWTRPYEELLIERGRATRVWGPRPDRGSWGFYATCVLNDEHTVCAGTLDYLPRG